MATRKMNVATDWLQRQQMEIIYLQIPEFNDSGFFIQSESPALQDFFDLWRMIVQLRQFRGIWWGKCEEILQESYNVLLIRFFSSHL